MSTSRKIAPLSKPIGDTQIPSRSFVYLQTRTKHKLFSLVHEKLRSSGITQAQLAKRLGKGTDRVCRLLGAPGNWTLETISDLLFAIDGGVLDPKISHPLDKAPRNDNQPHYVPRDFQRNSKSLTVSSAFTGNGPASTVSANTVTNLIMSITGN
jgi:hypothetical protein